MSAYWRPGRIRIMAERLSCSVFFSMAGDLSALVSAKQRI